MEKENVRIMDYREGSGECWRMKMEDVRGRRSKERWKGTEGRSRRMEMVEGGSEGST